LTLGAQVCVDACHVESPFVENVLKASESPENYLI